MIVKSMALAGLVVITAATSADAAQWKRTGEVTGPYGGVTQYSLTRECQYGVCTFQGQAIGPRGGMWSGEGSARRLAPGVWQFNRSVTNPWGGISHRRGTIWYHY